MLNSLDSMSNSDRQVILEVDKAGFRYRPDQVLIEGLDLQILAGQFLAIVGPNGVGKSTLLRLLAGLLVPQQGRVNLLGRRLKKYSQRQLARHIAFLPQQPIISFDYTAQQVVLMGRFPHRGLLGLDDQRDLERAREVMTALEVQDMAQRPLSQLSGGERQRVLLAAALAQYQPGTSDAVLLLDEPTAALDLKHQVGIFAMLDQLNRQFNLTIIVVTHDLNLASMFCRQLVLLEAGRVTAQGSAQSVLTAANVRRAYGLTVQVRADPTSGRPYILPEIVK